MQNMSIDAPGRKADELNDKIAWQNKQQKTPANRVKLLQLLFDTMPVGLLVQQKPGRIAFANRCFAEILGYQTDQLAGKPLNEIVYFDDQNDVSRYSKMVIAGESAPTRFIFRALTSDNKLKSLRVKAIQASWDDHPTLIWFVYDISKTKLPLMQSEKSQEMLCTLFDIVPVSTALVTWKEGRFIEANPSFYDNTGYLEEDVIGRTIAETGLWAVPGERSAVMRIVGDNGMVKSFPVKLRMSSGEMHDCIFSAQLVEYNDEPCTLEVLIDTSKEKFLDEVLTDKKRTIFEQTRQIQDLKATLKVLMDHRESEKDYRYQNLVIGLKKFAFPYLEKIKTGKIDNTSRTYLSMLEFNLEDLISSFPDNKASQMQNLTITETQVADLIRQDKSSKEIAEILRVSTAAISFHRHNLRKKFGLLKKKISLKTYLRSFDN